MSARVVLQQTLFVWGLELRNRQMVQASLAEAPSQVRRVAPNYGPSVSVLATARDSTGL